MATKKKRCIAINVCPEFQCRSSALKDEEFCYVHLHMKNRPKTVKELPFGQLVPKLGEGEVDALEGHEDTQSSKDTA